MAIQVLKIPPPGNIAQDDPMLNRWLLELTGILAQQGGIDAEAINNIQAVLTVSQEQLAKLTNTIDLLQRTINLINGRLSTSATVPTAAQGQDQDWVAVTGIGKGVYVKISGAWVLIAN